jgi:hypothetical protein
VGLVAAAGATCSLPEAEDKGTLKRNTVGAFCRIASLSLDDGSGGLGVRGVCVCV